MKKNILISVFALFLVLVAGQNAFACKCSDPPTVEQSFEQSAGVFYGRVGEINEGEKVSSARFEIEKSWKGADKDETIVFTDTSSCGIAFKTGESYYLFVDREPGTANAYRVAACRRHAGSQEEFLKNKPLIQLKSIRGGANALLKTAAAITGGIVALAALVVAVVVFKRKKA